MGVAERPTSTDAAKSVSASPPPFALEIADLLSRFGVDPKSGLPDAEAASRKQKYGENRLAEAPGRPAWKRFLDQFSDLVIWILIVAAVISGAMGEWIDAGAIIAIVLLNGILGFVQESKAERALAALQGMSAPNARVHRSGVLKHLPATELVPGDCVDLEAGDRVPADVRLIESFSLASQEAALTGESVPVEKKAKEVLAPATPLGDRHNMLYMGTVVTSGKGKGIVAGTGMTTELGRIAELLRTTEREPTPLQRQLAQLGRLLVVVCLALVAVVFALQLWHDPTLRGLLRHGEFLEALKNDHMSEVFLVSVSLAVAAVPEGLPAVVTLALALGLQRMVKRNALVRKLSSVETLGAVTTICSDKTGTLTRNEMTVREVIADGVHCRVTGGGYKPEGKFFEAEEDRERNAAGATSSASPSERGAPESGIEVDPKESPGLRRLLEVAAWCNNAELAEPNEETRSWQVLGDPTEGALLVAALKAGIDVRGEQERKIDELPFDSDRKMMSVVVQHESGAMMYSKGAPEAILAQCASELRGGEVAPLDDRRRQEIEASNQKMAGRALRVLAFAFREHSADAEELVEKDLVFAGLCGMIDPPRDEARDAVAVCRTAGIRPVMITGDHPATAAAIARELRLADGEARVMTGAELNELAEGELAKRVDDISVFARVSAEHKLQVVRALKSRKQIVAMTGDGVNDAPAVKAADIGVAMGITGTDVTKEASSMVLMDDNFASIVSAVEEGRCIYDNIRNVLSYLLSCNAGEILLMLGASLLGWHAPLVAIQLLWINLVTDSLPALALSVEKPGPGIMQRPPRPVGGSILSSGLGWAVILQGLLIAVVVLTTFHLFGGNENLDRARSAAFCVLVFSELLRSFAARNLRLTTPEIGFFTNPWLLGAILASAALQVAIVMIPAVRPIFSAVEHTPREWLMIAGLALTDITVIEITKLVLKQFRKTP